MSHEPPIPHDVRVAGSVRRPTDCGGHMAAHRERSYAPTSMGTDARQVALDRLTRASLPPQACRGDASAQKLLIMRMAQEVPQVVIVAETMCQRTEAQRFPALELYQGGCFGALRMRVEASLLHRLRVFVLTSRHGLVGANEQLRPYEPLLANRVRLKSQIRKRLHPYLDLCPAEEVLLLMATHHLDVLPRVTGHVGEVHTIIDPVRQWPRAAFILDRWGWP